MDSREYFKTMKYQGSVLRYSLNAYYLDFARINGNLSETLLNVRLTGQESFLANEVLNKNLWPGLSREEVAVKNEELRQKLTVRERQEVEQFFIIAFNQALVMMCTAFDTFLVDCLKVITFKKPEILKALSVEGDITVDEIVNTRSYEEIFESIQEKVLKRFDFAGIDGKLKQLSRIGVQEYELFQSSEEFVSRFPNPANFLRKIYSDRHNIVHKEQLVITKYDELSDISFFLIHIITKWGAFNFAKKFNISSDISLMYRTKINAQELDLG